MVLVKNLIQQLDVQELEEFSSCERPWFYGHSSSTTGVSGNRGLGAQERAGSLDAHLLTIMQKRRINCPKTALLVSPAANALSLLANAQGVNCSQHLLKYGK